MILEEKKSLRNVADESGHEIAELDTSQYYRLFNAKWGHEYALDIDEYHSPIIPRIARLDKNRQSQRWRFATAGKNIYQIQNSAKPGLSLLYDGDFADLKIFFADTTETVYQYWSAFVLENGQYKFFSRNLNEEQFLSISSINLYVQMSAMGSNDAAQRWTLEMVRKFDE